MCRTCGLAGGLELWCEGHAATGVGALAALRDLPPEWDVVTRLWWVATGEVRLDRLVVPPTVPLHPQVRAALSG